MKTNILPFPRDRISNSFPNPPAFLITEKLQKKLTGCWKTPVKTILIFLNNLKGKVSGIMESRHRTDTTTEERTVLPMKRDRKAGT